MKIVADNKIPFLKGAFEPFGKVEYYAGKDITPEVVKDADALIVRTRTECNAHLLKGSSVKFIATATIGFDHIDTQFCKQNHIIWKNSPGCNSSSVMQYTASVLATLSEKYNLDYSNTTIGIIGVGNVGSKVAKLASLLGIQVLLNDPPRERAESKNSFVSLDTIANKANIISFHVPLTTEGVDKTYHLFDNEFLTKVNPDTIIINSSRGEVVSGKVLKKALKEKIIRAAVLDVWEDEPNIDTELLNLVDIATSHIAGYSVDGKANGTTMSVRAISEFFGLGLNNWFPHNLPEIADKIITIDCKNLTCRQILNRAILSTYNVNNDDHILRKSTTNFENHRNNYPVRREFNLYNVILHNDLLGCGKKLQQMGFNKLT